MRKIALIIAIILNTLIVYGLKPEREYKYRPENYGLIYKEVNVKTKDGYKIKTWFFPAQDSLKYEECEKYWKNPDKREYKTLDNKKRPTIIFCDGDAGNMSYLLGFARELSARGFNAVTFDWRGFGKSDDFTINPDYLCYTEFLTDYRAVIDEVNKLPEVEDNKIGLFGFSTGAYLSFAAAYQNEKVKCFAGRALMTSFDEVVPILKQLKPDKNFIVPADYPIDLMPVNIAPLFNKPTFLIVGAKDDRTPVAMSEKIYNKLQGEKEKWIVENAQHGGADGPEFIDFDRFINRLTEFFYKYLKN